VKYVLVTAVVFLAVVAGLLAREGLMTKQSFMKLIGREATTETEPAPVIVPTLGGSVGEKLAAREKELDAREQTLGEEAERLETERRELDKLLADVDKKLKQIQGEIDTQDAGQATKLKKFAQSIAAMDSKKAAALIGKLEKTEDAIRVLESIDAKKSAKIYDEMDDETRSRITQQIVGGK